MFDVSAHDDSVVVEIPARLLYELLSISQGYSQSNGRWLPKQSIQQRVQYLLQDHGFDVWGEPLLRWDHDAKQLTPREELLP
jgi:hypothetical protein